MSAQRNSILCPNCRKLISLDEPACPYCGLVRPGLHETAGKLQNILFAFEPVQTILYVNIAFLSWRCCLIHGEFLWEATLWPSSHPPAKAF